LYIQGNYNWRWIAGYAPDYGVGNGFGLYSDTMGAYLLSLSTSGYWYFGSNDHSSSHRVSINGTGYATSDFRAPIFYDSNNTGYYTDPNSRSNLYSLTLADSNEFFRLCGSISTTNKVGIGFENDSGSYAIFKPYGAWIQPLHIAFHTGIKIGAQSAYSGTRFYNTEGMVTQIMSVGAGDNAVRVDYDFRTPIFYDNNDTNYYVDPNSTSRVNLVNATVLRSYENIYTDQNYGYGHVGVYSSYRYQGVFAMGDAYKLPASGANTGNLYGLAWSHPNAGGAAGNLTDHGLLLLNNGTFKCAISNSIVAAGNITAYSDERLKTNWRNMPDDYVSKLALVKVGIYERTDDNVTQVGVSAQSLQKLLPEAVITSKDEMQTLSVSYGNAALASTVELAKKAVEQEERINRLEKLIEELKAQLNGN
jgi:hypothetical protein